MSSSDRVYVANGADGTVTILSGDDGSVTNRIELGGDADNIRLDPTSQGVVGYGKGGLAFLDPVSGARTAEIALPAHPEGFQLEPAGPRIFVNLPQAQEIAVADRTSGKIIAAWRSAEGANFAMALEEAGRQVIAAFRAPPVLGFFDRETGTSSGFRPARMSTISSSMPSGGSFT